MVRRTSLRTIVVLQMPAEIAAHAQSGYAAEVCGLMAGH